MRCSQRKPEEQATFDQVLKLVENMAPEAQEQLINEMKLQWLRRAADQVEESLAQGNVYSQEELDSRLDTIRAQIAERQKT